MSGGSLDYFYNRLEEHVGDFDDKELDELVKDLAQLFHDREWYLSCDYGQGQWNESRDKFKEKWFSEGAREERINKYLEEIKQELLCSFGIDKRYCQTCQHWDEESDNYGKCKFANGHLDHKCDSCERWESKEKS